MKWNFVLKDPEAGDVLKQLTWVGVKILLDEDSHNEAIKIIESFLRTYKKCYWTRMIRAIKAAIRQELIKSRNVIDVKMIQEVVEFLGGGEFEGLEVSKKNDKGSDDDLGSDDSEGPSDEWDYEQDRYQGSESELESEEDLSFEDVDDDDDENNLSLINVPVPVPVPDWEASVREAREEFKNAKWRQNCIESIRRLSKEKGLSAKEGDEEEILNMVIPFISGPIFYYDEILIFVEEVREHIDRGSILDNVETVKNALESILSVREYDECKINSREKEEEEEEEDTADAKNQVLHSLEKNMVPTEEEIATTMNQRHQEEKREYGDKMEIEEQEILIRSNQREQAKESTGNADSCIRESLAKGGTNKRKFAEV